MPGLRERKKQHTRNLIVQQAGELFATAGFDATTVEDIAAACDVSVGTVYNYFGNKNTILLAHLEDEVGEMIRSGATVLAAPPDTLTNAVCALTDIYIDGMAGIERPLLRELFAAGFGPSPDVLPELMRFDDMLIGQLTALLAEFDEQLTPGSDPDDAVALFYSILITQLLVYVSVPATTSAAVRSTVTRHIRLACAGVCAPERDLA